MAAEIWAAYSVRDHLRPNAFLADVVMYDHLVVPVPPPGDTTQWARWKDENSWKPERQRELLDALGPVVTRVPWTAERQAVWESSYLQSRSQIGVGFSKSWAYELTAAGLFDVVPAMAKPVVATTPFTSWTTSPGNFRSPERLRGSGCLVPSCPRWSAERSCIHRIPPVPKRTYSKRPSTLRQRTTTTGMRGRICTHDWPTSAAMASPTLCRFARP